MHLADLVQVIDSHTEGEPTRVVLSGQPDLGRGSLLDRLHRLRTDFDHFRAAVVSEPRGSEVVVGALLLEASQTDCEAAVIFFNDVGYLGMCGHGTIGLMTTLAHLGRIRPGMHRLETPVGIVSAHLHEDRSVTVENVPSHRFRAAVPVDVPGYGMFVGDIAWGGNWFFLIAEHGLRLASDNCTELLAATTAIRDALHAQGITGDAGQEIDHIELFAPPADPANSSRNFVLCPGAAFDRSPCGTGTSAKMACLHADGKFNVGDSWRQEGILGTVFLGSITESADSKSQHGQVIPSIRARAWITAESTLHFQQDDPFAQGIRF